MTCIKVNGPTTAAILAERIPMQDKIVCKRALSISAFINAVLRGERLVCLMAKVTRPPIENVPL